MFETFENAEIKSPWVDAGIKVWSSAHQSLHLPWLYVDYEASKDGEVARGMALLFTADQLNVMSNEVGVKVKNVYLHTPSYLNNTAFWKMDLLKSVSVGYVKVKNKSNKFTKYVLHDLTQIYYPTLESRQRFSEESKIYSSEN